MFKISEAYRNMLINMVVTFVASFFAVSLAFYLHPVPKIDGCVPAVAHNVHPTAAMKHAYPLPQNMIPGIGRPSKTSSPATEEKGMRKPFQKQTSSIPSTSPAGPNAPAAKK